MYNHDSIPSLNCKSLALKSTPYRTKLNNSTGLLDLTSNSIKSSLAQHQFIISNLPKSFFKTSKNPIYQKFHQSQHSEQNYYQQILNPKPLKLNIQISKTQTQTTIKPTQNSHKFPYQMYYINKKSTHKQKQKNPQKQNFTMSKNKHKPKFNQSI